MKCARVGVYVGQARNSSAFVNYFFTIRVIRPVNGLSVAIRAMHLLPNASNFSPNPVMAVLAIGLTPIFPVIFVVPVVEIPDFDNTTKVPAVPRFTGARSAADVDAELEIVQFVGGG